MTPICRCAISIAVLVALQLSGAVPALGATHTWIGPTNGKWSEAGNWSGGKPTSGEIGGTIVKFGANTTSSIDIAGLVVDQIDFTGAGNTISGSTPLTISGSALIQNLVSEGGENTLGATLHLTISGAAVEAASNAGTLTVAGPIGGADGLVFVGSGGESALTGNNTYTGSTTIDSGALHIATPIGVVIAGSSLTIGTGAGPGAKLVLDQSSDISPETPVTVNSDGVFDFQTYSDAAKSLTVNGGHVLGASLIMTGPLVMKDGTITIGSILRAGSLSMTGGTISAAGAGPGLLALSGNIQATSSPSGPATLASGVQLKASPTVTVVPGTAPELRLTGAISETGGSRSITKEGAGTMLTSAVNTYTGTTTINAGTLVADGSQTGAFQVGQNGTLTGSGTLGPTTVEGVLAPTAPGLSAGSLSFGSTGKLDVALTSAAPEAIPSTIVKGTVAIDPSTALNLVVAPGTAVPQGSNLLLIDNEGPEAIAGQFAGLPNGSVLSPVEGVPLEVNYAGGDGNDLSLTANVPPQVAAKIAIPTSVAPGPPPGAGPTGTSTIKASGYGAEFGLTAPSACTRQGGPFSVTLSIKKTPKRKAKGSVLVKVTKVLFAINGKTAKTVRSTPFRAQLTVPHSATSGTTIKLLAKAYLKLNGGKGRTKSVAVAIKVC